MHKYCYNFSGDHTTNCIFKSLQKAKNSPHCWCVYDDVWRLLICAVNQRVWRNTGQRFGTHTTAAVLQCNAKTSHRVSVFYSPMSPMGQQIRTGIVRVAVHSKIWQRLVIEAWQCTLGKQSSQDSAVVDLNQWEKEKTSLLTETSFDMLSRSGLAVACLTAVRDQEVELSTHSV